MKQHAHLTHFVVKYDIMRRHLLQCQQQSKVKNGPGQILDRLIVVHVLASTDLRTLSNICPTSASKNRQSVKELYHLKCTRQLKSPQECLVVSVTSAQRTAGTYHR